MNDLSNDPRNRIVAEGFDYQAEAYKTCSPHWNPHNVEFDGLLRTLSQFVDLCGVLNVYYKLLLRGKTPDQVGMIAPAYDASLAAHGGTFPASEIDLVHAILGGASEIGELVEVALDMLEGKPADRVNVIEEVGDMRWFLNLALRWADCSDLQCEMTNIDKLHGRHGSAFDIFRDANRDLERERASLKRAPTNAEMFDEDEPCCPPHCCCCDPGDTCCDCGQVVVTHVERKPIGDTPGMDC
jgi:hypothetical protein